MAEPAVDPKPTSRASALAYALLAPPVLLLLLFLPAGSITWRPGWIFLAVEVAAFTASALIIAWANPVIYRARSRFQPGTKAWDKILLSVMLPAMVAILPLAALDAGRFHWSRAPLWVVVLGYGLTLGAVAVTAWAQAVNPYFEPGVRIQSERHQHVIDTGPYRWVRHPGYSAALVLFFGMALALGSFWALIPAALASGMLIVRTIFEDRLLRAELAGYLDYARRVPWRLVPAFW